MNVGIRPSANSIKKETGRKGDKCVFPHYKVDEQPNKKPKKSNIPKEEKATTRMLYHNWGCVSQDSDALVFSR